MAKFTFNSSNLTSGWFSLRGPKSTIYLNGTWASGQVQIEFKTPDGTPNADDRYVFTKNTVTFCETGDSGSVRGVFSGGSGTESVDMDVWPR